ncbi:MAG TPA: ABC transporter substrate-binding protein, partial [Burkholderiaceae bacterium]|nr:ABC transporter substrate-binding protein [Burkholderiaceae bacterium]
AGTTAHVFLDNALRANGVDPKEVEVVNQRMSEAVTSFISGAVPAGGLWGPLKLALGGQGPRAQMAVRGSAHSP